MSKSKLRKDAEAYRKAQTKSSGKRENDLQKRIAERIKIIKEQFDKEFKDYLSSMKTEGVGYTVKTQDKNDPKSPVFIVFKNKEGGREALMEWKIRESDGEHLWRYAAVESFARDKERFAAFLVSNLIENKGKQ